MSLGQANQCSKKVIKLLDFIARLPPKRWGTLVRLAKRGHEGTSECATRASNEQWAYRAVDLKARIRISDYRPALINGYQQWIQGYIDQGWRPYQVAFMFH
jgi:hypothetical protein